MTTATPTFPIGITAMGMVSSLGHDVVTSCAAARAGLSQASSLDLLDFKTQSLFGEETLDGPPEIFGHAVRDLAEGFSDIGKALLLGAAALRDLLGRRELSPREVSRTGLCVNLSDWAVRDAAALHREERDIPSVGWKARTSLFPSRLADAMGLAIPPGLQRVFHGGNAGMAEALHQAIMMLEGGSVDRCVVGGIDSLIEPGFLVAAATLGILRTNVLPVGLVAGEGAAFLLIERVPSGSSQARAHLARCAHEPARQEPSSTARTSTASALTKVLRSTLASPSGQSEGDVWFIGDLDGTAYRAREWSYSLTQIHGELGLGDAPLWVPASSFGSTGAASGAIAMCLSTRAFERGYAPATRCSVWMCSEAGARGSVLLRAAMH